MKIKAAFAHYKNALLMLIGYASVALGIIGAFLPIMPTTVFLIIALACFSRVSPTLALRLMEHPKFGASLRLWQQHKAIPLKAKFLALVGMFISYLLMQLLPLQVWLLCSVGLLKVIVLVYIFSRPSTASY